MVKYNINDYVRVKLTPKGIEALKQRHEEFNKLCLRQDDFIEPGKDAEGYTKYQLWELIQVFGNYVGLGMTVPFETEIIIELDKQ